MRIINTIVVHSSATQPLARIRAATIKGWHEAQGWKDIGYHFVVCSDAKVEPGRALDQAGAHVSGHNANSIGICLVGGVDARGRAVDNYSADQKDALFTLIQSLRARFPTITRVVGHRDLFPDRNRNGRVDAHERLKECPCFDVIPWYAARVGNGGPR